MGRGEGPVGHLTNGRGQLIAGLPRRRQHELNRRFPVEFREKSRRKTVKEITVPAWSLRGPRHKDISCCPELPGSLIAESC